MLQPFWSHVEDLRQLVLRCLCVIILAGAISFFFTDRVILFTKTAIPPAKPIDIQQLDFERIVNRSNFPFRIELPGQAVPYFLSPNVESLASGVYLLPANGFVEITKPKEQLLLLSPIEGFMTTLKVAFWLGILISGPIWILLIVQFIMPALHPLEKRLLLPSILTTLIMIAFGLLTAIHFTLPLTNAYFASFNRSLGMNAWSLSNYLDYVLTIFLGHGIAFAAASILFLAIFFQVISASFLEGYRRQIIIAILVMSAFLTPPDVLSQLLLAIPLYILFEAVLLYGKWKESRSRAILKN